MNRKFILAGFATGLLSNAAGVVLYILIFSQAGIPETLRDATENDYLGKIIVLGAALNFLPFFIFINRNIYVARGVLLATLFVAVLTVLIKIL